MNCPSCSSSNAKRCEVLYAQGTSISYGSEHSAFNVSGMASRASPPQPPIHPSYFKKRLLLLGVPGLLLCLLAVVFCLMLLVNKGPAAALGGLIPGILGGYLLWQAWPPQGALSETAYHRLSVQYVESMRLYSTLWACLDCGHVFQPGGGSGN